jgi:two-component system nitrate/nitrite response regulator NarL
VRVLVVDDHPVVREGLHALLLRGGFSVVGMASEALSALELAGKTGAEMAVVDVALPGISGLELCRRLRRRFPGMKVVLISMFDEPEWKAEAARAGASAYLLKDLPAEEILAALRRVANGENLLPAAEPALPLTAREREVVRLLAQGKKTPEIAELLSRSVTTIRAHKVSAMRKLGVRSTRELLQAALRLGLLPNLNPPEP